MWLQGNNQSLGGEMWHKTQLISVIISYVIVAINSHSLAILFIFKHSFEVNNAKKLNSPLYVLNPGRSYLVGSFCCLGQRWATKADRLSAAFKSTLATLAQYQPFSRVKVGRTSFCLLAQCWAAEANRLSATFIMRVFQFHHFVGCQLGYFFHLEMDFIYKKGINNSCPSNGLICFLCVDVDKLGQK